MDCPREDRLQALNAGELPLGELDLLGEHLNQCPRCVARLAECAETDRITEFVAGDTAVAPWDDREYRDYLRFVDEYRPNVARDSTMRSRPRLPATRSSAG